MIQMHGSVSEKSRRSMYSAAGRVSGGLPAGSGIKREWYSAGVLSATQLQQRAIKMQQKSAKKTAPLKPFLSPAFRVQFWRSRLTCTQASRFFLSCR